MARVSLDAEPSIAVLSPEENTYNVQLMRIMNWYSAEKAKSDARKYMRDYVKAKMSSELNTFDQVKDVNIVNTYGWISRIIMRNGKISDRHLTSLNRYLKETLDSAIYIPEPVQQKVVVSAPKPSIQDAMKEKISEYLGELEGSFDSVVTNKEDFSLYKNMQANQIPKPYVNDIKEWSKNKLREYITVYEGKDSQLVEGYSNITKRELKSIVKMLAQFIEDCDKYSEFKKANRKPRIVKAKPASVQVKNLKYKKEDTELGITSVDPAEIIGAQQVWVFNSKTRKLALYKTDSAMGIVVKGSSFQNYDPEMGCQKTLRKPADQLKDLMGATKVQLRKYMDSVSSKASPANGRMNVDTLILRVIK